MLVDLLLIQLMRKSVLAKTGHAEVVQVVFDKQNCNYSDLLKLFFESHNPTQGMRQGNDRGTQYRSIILYKNEQQKVEANQIKDNYNQSLTKMALIV